MRERFRPPTLLALALLILGGASCHTARPLTFVPRKGDEIVVAGRMFQTGTRVVTWMDPRGDDPYRAERRFAPLSVHMAFTRNFQPEQVDGDLRAPFGRVREGNAPGGRVPPRFDGIVG